MEKCKDINEYFEKVGIDYQEEKEEREGNKIR